MNPHDHLDAADAALLDPTDPHTDDEAISDARQRRLILITMCVALIAVIASVSGLNVAQQELAADLGATQSQLLWIINGYTLTLAALLMPVGAIGDRWGRKPILLAGLALFAIANAASAFVTTTSFPAHERAKAVGTWAGVAGAGGIIGLFISAAIIDNTTWPWVFAFPVTVAVIALAGTIAIVPHSREHVDAGFDIAGSILSVIAVGGIVLAFHEGPEQGWTHLITIAGVVAGIAGTVAFVFVELRRDHPLLDVRLFANPGLSTGSVNLFVVFAIMFALFLTLVQFLQAVLGYTALGAAAGLLPMAAAMMPLSTMAPTIAHRIGYRRTVATGMAMIAVALVWFALVADPDSGYLPILPTLLLLGVGVGLAMSPSTTAITASLPEDKQGVASALNDTVREMGGAIGIALIGSILNAQYRSNITPVTETLPPELAEPVKEGIGGALAAASQAGPDSAIIIDAARQAFADGLRPAMFVAAALCAAAAVFTILTGISTRRDAAISTATATG